MSTIDGAFGGYDTDIEADDVQRGLSRYVRAVAAALGVPGHAYWCDAASPPAEAYLALVRRLPGFAERDLALVWDADHGWALAIESASGEDLIIVTYHGGELFPSPDSVRTFVRAALAGERPGQPDPPFRDGSPAWPGELKQRGPRMRDNR